MISSQAIIKIENGLNKLSSSDYQNITKERMQDAVNEAVLTVCRERIPVKEATNEKMDDIQVLLMPPQRVSGSDKGKYFESHTLPPDYFAMSRVTPICTKGYCTTISMKSDLVEDANIDTYLSDWSRQPSFDFEQTFHTLFSNRIKQYHNGDFEVKELELSYYRKPTYIQLPQAYLPTGGQGIDMKWEFKDDFCEIIIKEAISILAGQTENLTAYQINSQQPNNNKR